MACCDGDLQFDEIEAGDLLGDGMLDLKARIHFEEVEIEIGVDEKFDGACVGVAACAREAHGGFAHFFAQVGRHDRRWSFFDHFLVAALDGAFAFAERNDAAVLVGEDLDFDVVGLFEIFFEIEARVAERVHGFGAGVAIGGSELGAAVHEAHAFAAAAGDGFEENGKAHGLREGVSFFGLFDGVVESGNGGYVGAARDLAAGGFGAEGFHGLRGGADEGDAGFGRTRAGERRFRRGSRSRDGWRRRLAFRAYGDDFVDVEIAFARGGGADRVGLVGEADVEGFAIDFAEDGDGTDAEFAAGAEDADCDFSSVGDQDFFEHEGFVATRRGEDSSMRDVVGRMVRSGCVSNRLRCK